MNFLIGWLIGERIAGAAGDINDANGNALWGIFWWIVIGVAAHYGFASNFGPKYAGIGETAVLLLLLLFCLYRPVGSTFKFTMLAGIIGSALVARWISGGVAVLILGYELLSGHSKRMDWPRSPRSRSSSAP